MKTTISLTVDKDILETFDSHGIKRSGFVEKCMKDLVSKQEKSENIEETDCFMCKTPVFDGNLMKLWGKIIHRTCYTDSAIEEILKLKPKKE